MEDLKTKAINFATKVHGEQVRKYTGEPYVTHTIAVANKLEQLEFHERIVCAAVLHDTVEDTPTNLQDIEENFGVQVARMVEDLTDVYTKEAFPLKNRKERKLLEAQRLSNVGGDSKSIKLADIIDNLPSIIEHGKGFAEIFLVEAKQLIGCLEGGDSRLLTEAKEMLLEAEIKLT